MRAKLLLFESAPARFIRFCEDYNLSSLRAAFSPDNIEVIRDHDGRELPDIMTAEDNAAVADAIMRRIRDLAADSRCAIHASVAGGRKTMGVALALAMSLFGREQDRLSHVLVSPPFESHPDFFYPPPEPRVLLVGAPPQQRPVSTEEARVSLAEIPFLRLRGMLDPALLAHTGSWQELIERAQNDLAPHQLRIEPAAGRVQLGEREVPMPPAARAFLLMLARRAMKGEPGAPCPTEGAPDVALAQEYVDALHIVQPEAERRRRTEEALRHGMDKNFFERRKHEVNGALRRILGPGPASAFLIGRQRDANGRYRHDLPLKPEQIIIREE